MDIGAFITEYFVDPIIQHEGYNPINTLVYAIIAIACAFGLYKWFIREGMKFDREFMLRLIPFILLGSTVRVVTDSIDVGVMQAYTGFMKPIYDVILESHIYDYGLLTATPGIYVVIGIMAILALVCSSRCKNPNLGATIAWGLFAVHFLLLVPLFVNYTYAVLIIFIAAAIAGVYYALKKTSKVPLHWLVIFAQVLDGAATFVTLDIFNRHAGGMYVEQHVFANSLYTLFGGSMLPFLALKVLLPILIVWFLEKEENSDERTYIAMLVIIFGLAPGLRDLLRLAAGT